jgi:hypothetical protein
MEDGEIETVKEFQTIDFPTSNNVKCWGMNIMVKNGNTIIEMNYSCLS